MNAPLYTLDILRLAAELPERRQLEREDGRAEVRSPTCGSRIVLAVQLQADGRIEAVSQQVHACAFGQASAALLEQGAAGHTLEEVDCALGQLGGWLAAEGEPPSWPGIEALAPARSRKSRHAAILLPFRALRAAMTS